MMQMNGPYVAELYCCFADEDNIYLVMEYCDGGDLFKSMLLHGGQLDEHYVCVDVSEHEQCSIIVLFTLPEDCIHVCLIG